MTDEKQAPFAIIILTNLRVARFQTKDEWQDAMKNLRERDRAFIPVKYHFGIERYETPEVVEPEELRLSI